MKTKITHDVYGEIAYEESFWTGKRQISIGGKTLTKSKRNVYVYKDLNTSLTAVLKGSLLFGLTISVNNEAAVRLLPAPQWYEILFFSLILSIGLFWGNIAGFIGLALVGGAIGGAISGLMAALYLAFSKSIPKIGYKILLGIAFLGGTFFICHIVALMIIAALL